MTADTTFSIGPDGSCTGATCTATVAGAHTVTGVDGAFSATASLEVDPGPPDHVSFGQSPTDVQEASAITPVVTVTVQDAYGNTVTSSTARRHGGDRDQPEWRRVERDLELPDGPRVVCQSAVGGVATFADLSIDMPGTGYTLAAGSMGLTGATSGPFTVFVVLEPCVGGGCIGSTGANATSTNTTVLQNVSIPARQLDGTLELGSDPSSEAVAATFCGGQTCLAGSFIMQVVPPTNSTYLTDQPITVVLALDKSIAHGNGVPTLQGVLGQFALGSGHGARGLSEDGPDHREVRLRAAPGQRRRRRDHDPDPDRQRSGRRSVHRTAVGPDRTGLRVQRHDGGGDHPEPFEDGSGLDPDRVEGSFPSSRSSRAKASRVQPTS